VQGRGRRSRPGLGRTTPPLLPPVDAADLGRHLLGLLGERGSVELPAVLELRETERATLIGQLYESERGQRLAELLLDVETDPDDLVRLRLIGALRDVLGSYAYVQGVASATSAVDSLVVAREMCG
jgi:hypothetical protein